MRATLNIQCDPKPLSRARSSSGRMYYPQNKQDEMNELSWHIRRAIANWDGDKQSFTRLAIESKNISVSMEFGLPIPSSYSHKKRVAFDGYAHTRKPDLDNLIKNVLDRGNGLLWADDKFIHTITAKKIWADKGYIKIEIEYE